MPPGTAAPAAPAAPAGARVAGVYVVMLAAPTCFSLSPAILTQVWGVRGHRASWRQWRQCMGDSTWTPHRNPRQAQASILLQQRENRAFLVLGGSHASLRETRGWARHAILGPGRRWAWHRAVGTGGNRSAPRSCRPRLGERLYFELDAGQGSGRMSNMESHRPGTLGAGYEGAMSTLQGDPYGGIPRSSSLTASVHGGGHRGGDSSVSPAANMNIPPSACYSGRHPLEDPLTRDGDAVDPSILGAAVRVYSITGGGDLGGGNNPLDEALVDEAELQGRDEWEERRAVVELSQEGRQGAGSRRTPQRQGRSGQGRIRVRWGIDLDLEVPRAVEALIKGPWDPDGKLWSRQVDMATVVIERSGGVVFVEQLASILNPPGDPAGILQAGDGRRPGRRKGSWDPRSEAFVLRLLEELDGVPEVTADGDILYVFPGLAGTGQRQGQTAERSEGAEGTMAVEARPEIMVFEELPGALESLAKIPSEGTKTLWGFAQRVVLSGASVFLTIVLLLGQLFFGAFPWWTWLGPMYLFWVAVDDWLRRSRYSCARERDQWRKEWAEYVSLGDSDAVWRKRAATRRRARALSEDPGIR